MPGRKESNKQLSIVSNPSLNLHVNRGYHKPHYISSNKKNKSITLKTPDYGAGSRGKSNIEPTKIGKSGYTISQRRSRNLITPTTLTKAGKLFKNNRQEFEPSRSRLEFEGKLYSSSQRNQAMALHLENDQWGTSTATERDRQPQHRSLPLFQPYCRHQNFRVPHVRTR